jgi:hypothetical protein
MGAATTHTSGFGDDVDARRAEAVLVTVRAMLGLAASDADSSPERSNDTSTNERST